MVAASTAQRFTALGAVRSPLTPPSSGPCHPAVWIRTTVVRRPVDVDQLRVGDGFPALAFLSPAKGRTPTGKDGGATARVEGPGGGGSARTRRYLHGVLVLGLESVSDLAERRDGSPTRLDSARSRHAVTTTLHLHQRRQNLQQQRTVYNDIHICGCKWSSG